MAANTGERTLISAIVPPGAAHIDGVFSLAAATATGTALVDVSAALSALTTDVLVRAAPKSNIRAATVERLPLPTNDEVMNMVRLRFLRLNCITLAYADLWQMTYNAEFAEDAWAIAPLPRGSSTLSVSSRTWTSDVPLRLSAERRQALLEIDVLVAIGLDVSAAELCTIYRTQFPVLAGYDRNSYFFDQNGRMVPTAVLSSWRSRGNDFHADERIVPHADSGIEYQYEPPFVPRDREADMRQTYDVFEDRLAARRSNSE